MLFTVKGFKLTAVGGHKAGEENMNAEKVEWKIIMERTTWKAAMKLEDNIKVSQKQRSSKCKTFETSPVGITGGTECGKALMA
jgi:hypothetical protein